MSHYEANPAVTPTPWEVEESRPGMIFSGLKAVAAAEPDNARLIVKAVNSHDALVAKLAWIADAANKGANGGLNMPGKSNSVGDCKALMREIRDAARTVLEAV